MTSFTHSPSSITTPYRWLIFVLLVFGSLNYMYMWMSPAALISVIRADLHIDLGAAGVLITIIPLLSGIFVFGGSLVIDRLGLRWASALAMTLLAAGGALSYIAHDYITILGARILVGVGAGMASPTISAAVMAWFPPREQPFVNAFLSVLGYAGMTLAFVSAVPLLNLLGSWQRVLTAATLLPFATAIGWLLLGRTAPSETSLAPHASIDTDVKAVENSVLQAARRREVWLLTIAMAGHTWAFNTVSTFLPSWFESMYNLDKAAAGNITSILPAAGIAGGLLCGLATGAAGLRKPFMWPVLAAMLIACLVVANTAPGPLVYICVAVIGFASSGWIVPVLSTTMELRSATPQLVGGATALLFGLAFIVSFFVAPLFGAAVPLFGMKATLIVFSLPLLISVAALMALPETGPRKRAA